MSMPETLFLSYTFEGPRKIDLPEDVLRGLVHISSELSSAPLIFELSNGSVKKHVGVREFSAPESEIGLHEYWAQQLNLQVGDKVQISRATLPKGTEITMKIASQTDDSDIDWKSLLESWIPKNYTALSAGDVLCIPYLGKNHELIVTNVKPEGDAVCVLDTDMELSIIPSDAGPSISSETSALEFNKELKLPHLTTLTAEVPTALRNLYISCSELAFIGPEHATSDTSYISVIDSHPKSISTALLGSSFSITASGTLLISTSEHPLDNNGSSQCEFCEKQIPPQSFVLHTSFCQRNSARCTVCSRKFGNTKTVPEPHLRMHKLEEDGSGGGCECGEFSAPTAKELAFHRATSCNDKLHICQFCRLLVARGHTSPVDAASGLSGHESQCGNRTADCPLCNKPIRLRSLALHLNEHDEKRKRRQPPAMCANANCPNPLSTSTLTGLCPSCYGPLSVPGANQDIEKINRRIERRYALQMTLGCGRPWCQNQFCAMNHKRGAREASQVAKEFQQPPGNIHWFCVDEDQTRRAMFVAMENDYARGWRGLAISQCATESEAERWLQNNASKLSE